MSKRGVIAFYLFMLFVVIVILALAFAKPLTQNSEDAMDRISIQINYTDISRGLVGYYKLNENGVQVKEYAGFNINGTVNTSTFNSTGKINGAYDFNGVNNSINLGSNTSLFPTNFSYSVWVYPTNFPTAYNQIIGRDSGTNAYTVLLVKSNGKLAPYIYGTASINYDGTGSHTLTTGSWSHIVMTYNLVDGLSGYVNGELDGTASANGVPASTTANTTVGYSEPYGRYFNGTIDDVRIYNVSLSQSQINQIFNDGQGTEDDPLFDINATVTTNISCDNATTYQDRANCTSIDVLPAFFVWMLLGIAGVIIYAIGRGG